MDMRRARELVAAERRRIEAALRDLSEAASEQNELGRQQEGEAEAGSGLASGIVEQRQADLQRRLAAVERAEARIAAGTYGRSVDSGAVIPDERLEAEPLAERTVDEQRRRIGSRA